MRVPTTTELRVFKNNGRDGPKIDDLKLDLNSSGLRSPWNKEAARLFSQEFLSRQVYDCTDRKLIIKAFLVYLQALRTRYRKQNITRTSDEAAAIDLRDHAKKAARHNRRSYVSIVYLGSII